MSAHPHHCTACKGTGWMNGPTTHEIVNGTPTPYTTLIRCNHDHWNDDPHPDEPLDRNHPAAQAALARGYAAGLADLDAMTPKDTP